MPTTFASPLLAEALDAHGGLARWRQFTSLSATVVTGGAFWGMKNIDQDADPRRVTVDLAHEHASLAPFGDPDWSLVFVPDRIAIESSGGEVIAERRDPRASFAGHDVDTPWDPLHRAYFSGYALWTYLTAPFVLAQPDVEVAAIAPIVADGETWRGLRARFPARIATHSTEQDFYFGPDGLLRRHDYHVDVAGGFAAAHLVSDFVEAQGLRFPTRRRAYQRSDDLQPILDPVMVSIDLSDFALR
jgi:hypothetical protein